MKTLIALLACAALVACDSKNDSPAAPAATVSSVAIAPSTDLLKIRATEKWTLNATLTTGVVEAVTGIWRSDNTAVATVDASGTVTGVAAGSATISAEYQGRQTTRLLRVVPDYAGRWDGEFATVSCQVQGDFRPDWCSQVQGAAPMRLDLLQTRDFVSGSWTFLGASGVVQGNIAPGGTLTLEGTVNQGGAVITISNWQSVTTDNRTMSGRFTLVWMVPGIAGSARTDVEIRNATKS